MNITRTILAMLLLVSLAGNTSFAQNKKPAKKADAKEKTTTESAEKSYLITVTKLHRNIDHKGTAAEWKALEKEYFDKVTKKNDLIVGQEVLTHYFTEDNTEILLVTIYNSWADIENASAKNNELVKAAWPDETARNTFFDKREAFYANEHSDEILSTYPFAKLPKAEFTKPMIHYVRKDHFSFPKDGTEKEFRELLGKYRDEVINKNDFIKAYYPNVHAWGANKTEFTEVFVVESLADIEKMFDKDEELAKAAWPDKAGADAYWDKYNKYFTGKHSDYLYMSVPELTK